MPEELNINWKSSDSPGLIEKSIVKGCTPIAFTEKLEIIIKIKNIIIPDKCQNYLRKMLTSLYYKQ